MAFKFSKRSLDKLEGVHPDMVKLCHEAIKLTVYDFGITCGMRTLEEQIKLKKQGRSQTLKSKHLEGLAVDVLVYMDGEHTWDGAVYDEVADAFAQASRNFSIPVRWGGAWHINSIAQYNGTMEDATMAYTKLRSDQGRRAFFDGPHFELSAANVVAPEYE